MKNQLLSEIVKEVNEKGYHYVHLESLIPAFRCKGDNDICVEERMLVWAVKNHIIYEYKEEGNYTIVRFWGKGK